MSDLETTTIQIAIPRALISQAQKLVDAGRFRNTDEVFLDALRRYLETHRQELLEEFLEQDVEWGLSGDEQKKPICKQRNASDALAFCAKT